MNLAYMSVHFKPASSYQVGDTLYSPWTPPYQHLEVSLHGGTTESSNHPSDYVNHSRSCGFPMPRNHHVVKQVSLKISYPLTSMAMYQPISSGF